MKDKNNSQQQRNQKVKTTEIQKRLDFLEIHCEKISQPQFFIKLRFKSMVKLQISKTNIPFFH